jgi:hypothetical protein
MFEPVLLVQAFRFWTIGVRYENHETNISHIAVFSPIVFHKLVFDIGMFKEKPHLSRGRELAGSHGECGVVT